MPQIPFHCPKTDRHVILTKAVFRGISGIGDDNPTFSQSVVSETTGSCSMLASVEGSGRCSGGIAVPVPAGRRLGAQ
jgi:hypothetical protein